MNKKRPGFIITWIILAILIILVWVYCPDDLTQLYKSSYYTICMQLAMFWGIWVGITAKRKIDIFDPIVLLTVFHLLLFEITPLICLRTGDTSWYNEELWGGCSKATWISTGGYIAIIFAYFSKRGHVSKMENLSISVNYPQNCLALNYLTWFIAFLASVYLITAQGSSFTYMLKFGTGGSEAGAQSASNVEFLGILAYAMLPSYLYIFHLGRSRLVKLLLFYLMAASFFVRGFRFIMVAIIIAPFVFSFLKRDKRPGLMQITLVLLGLIIMVAFVGITRDSIRAGKGIAEAATSALTGEYIGEILIENFSIFKTYYGIVLNIPQKMSYTYGQLIFVYTLVMLIPRAFWAGKPYPISKDVNAIAVNSYASRAGTAYPYIGEYYHEFGVPGVLLFSYALGKFLKKLQSYMYKRDVHSLVLYASVYPLLMQILIRGYTPSNFYMILIVMIPVWFTRTIDGGKNE